MFNVNSYLNNFIGKEVIVKLKIGRIKCKIREVGIDGSLIVSEIKILESRDTTLKIWEEKDEVIIRKDSVVAIMIE